MSHIQLAQALRTIKRRKSWSRDQLLAQQERAFRELLSHAWKHSLFYRDYYSSHGIQESHLSTLAPRDLPLTNKELLMEHFDDVVTDKRLKKADLEQWIHEHPNPIDRYLKNHVVLHTSGTSGNIGVFVYDARAWAMLKASVVVRVSQPKLNPLRKIRVAFYGATHGRFASVTLASDAPKAFYQFLPLSIVDPLETTLTQLQSFAPTQLSGYASAIDTLAHAQLAGRLSISPERIMMGGDVLTSQMENTIRSAWNTAEVVNMYGATESVSIAAKKNHDTVFHLFEDLHIVDAFDEHNSPVAVGTPGRTIMTNLYNLCMPMIAYDMRDIITLGEDGTIAKIHGRQNDALPITQDNGTIDTIHPIVLSEFFVPGLSAVQFISDSPGAVVIHFVAPTDITKEIENAFAALLQQKKATTGTRVTVMRKEAIAKNPKTGKRQLVVMF